MPPLTVGELQVILSGDTSRLDRDMDRIDNRAGNTEKVHTAAWQRTGITAGEALAAGVGAGMDKLTRDAQGKLRNSRGQFATEAEILAAGMQPAFKKGGEDGGGVFAKGMRSGLIRNSPLIAAAIGGALIAGAPLVTAGAVALFAGAGAVAASQSLEIREAWTELGHEIRGGMVADAAVLVPAYTKMADQIGASFQRMRPMIREAFTDSVPLIESFTDGVIALAENAMPGLVRAVAAGQPVMDGLEDFLASTGTGLTEFLDAISGHAPAAGTAFASLGDILGDLLPMLGELLGQGAELAADVLPAVASATGLTLDVLQLLGPALPAIVAGFVAFKTAQTAAGYLQTFGQKLAFASYNSGALAGAAGKASTVVSGVGKALPALGVAVGVVGGIMSMAEQQTKEWAQALLDGGAAARVAREEMTAQEEAFDGAAAGFVNLAWGTTTWANALGVGTNASEEAEQAARDLYDAMNPLQQAQQDVERGTNYLIETLERYGAGSDQAKGAARALESQQGVLESRQATLELAIDGVTSAMIAQAEQALAAASSDYAYRSSLEGIDDAITGISEAQRLEAEAAAAVVEARAEHGAKSDEAAEAERRYAEATEATSDAQFRLEGTLLSAAEAAGRLAADALPATASELQKQQAAAAGSLAELERLKTEMGANFPPALQQAIDRLKQSGVALTNTTGAASVTAGAMRDLGLSVTEIPGQKFVRVDAPTAEQKQRLLDLGYHVTNLPNGDIYVSADTATANNAIDYAARPRKAIITTVVQGSVGPTPGSGPLRAGFASGGYTGNGPLGEVAGPVHRREFVVDAPNTARYRPLLEAMQSGNRQAASMLATAVAGPGGRASSARSGGSAGTGSASVGSVTQRHYHYTAAVTHDITPREFINLQQEADALYG